MDKGLSLDVEQIPDARSAPQLETLVSTSSMTFIVADVKTTDTTHQAEITQLSAAVLGNAANSFNVCLLPNREISKQATTVAKLAKG